jgi:8-oxo-dGTP diphosphatase
MKIGFIDDFPQEHFDYKYAIVVTMYGDRLLLVNHKDRDTWELPGGRRESNEEINETAKRELFEETGALKFELTPICDYYVEEDDVVTYGRLFFADIMEIDVLPDYEIEKIEFFDHLPDNLTYSRIQPVLLRKVMEEIDKGEF